MIESYEALDMRVGRIVKAETVIDPERMKPSRKYVYCAPVCVVAEMYDALPSYISQHAAA
jgi:hypothetical protein